MLHKFAPHKGAFTINAQHLDENFSRLAPLQPSGNAKHYQLTSSPHGWSMRIFPEFPNEAAGLYVLAVANGQMIWYPTRDCV